MRWRRAASAAALATGVAFGAVLSADAAFARSLESVFARGATPEGLRDPSRVVALGGAQMLAASGREQTDAYNCGLEIWLRGARGAPWRPGLCVFTAKPEWVDLELPQNAGAYRAPAFADAKTLYYSVGAGFDAGGGGCIGLARAIGDAPEDLVWRDVGKPVTCSFYDDAAAAIAAGQPQAIDPSVFTDADGTRYLVFGGGAVAATKLDDAGMPVSGAWWSAEDPNYTLLARRPAEAKDGVRWVDAPFMFRKGGFYYLFVSYYICCRGLESTSEIRVGRAASLAGPFLDKEGRRLDAGDESLVLGAGADRVGLSQAAVWTDSAGADWLTYAYVDKAAGGLARVGEAKIVWRDGWPETSG